MKKKLLAMLMVLALALTACSQGGNSTKDDAVTLNIAYQYGLAYAPLIIAKEQGLIEKAYKEKTGKEIKVEWHQMNSGADINVGITSGSLDVGFMGIAPAITGVTKNVGYKIFTNLSGQEHCLTTNDESIKSFDDLIDSKHQIAVVNVGSIQHIILAKALYDNGYDAHALDSNLVVMKHPDGMASLESGSIACHVTSSPYIFMERENEDLHELAEVNEAWTKDNSFIVGVASEKLYNNNKDGYDALSKGISDAIDYLNNNTEDAAKITCEFNGNSAEDELKYLKLGNYTTKTNGVFELAKFMKEKGFIEELPESYEYFVFDNVEGD